MSSIRLPSAAATLALVFWTAVWASPPAHAAEVPTFEEVSGHAFGERITQHHEMVRYLEAVAEASPRVTVVEQGESWEGRRFLLAVVTSPENHARLGEIREAAGALADARRTSEEKAAEIVEDQPAVVWLGGSIHGFELSGAEGMLKLFEHLARGEDPETLELLKNTVVLIDPMLNPDGRDAFAQANHQAVGRVPSGKRKDWANDFNSWEAIKYRTGHYYFDTNRDWFAHTQRETRARVATLAAWHPQVMVDAHEMGPDAEFFFDPPTDPVGPYYPQYSSRWHEVFGAAFAGAFDEAGFDYTTRELFNYFYPGYSTSYGSYQGAVGLLFEQGSSRGLALERSDESVRTLADALEQQYTAALATVRTAAENRQQLLEEYYQAHSGAQEAGRSGNQAYLLASGGDPGALEEAVALLRRGGVEVSRLTEDASLSASGAWGGPARERAFPPGTYVVEAAQPRERLVRVLFEPEQAIPEEFLAEARKRLERGENPRFYDITAWSLPLLFHLDGASTAHAGALAMEPVTEPLSDQDLYPEAASAAELPPEAYAYTLDGRRADSLAALSALKARGYRAVVTTEAGRVGGRDLASGTVILRGTGRGVKREQLRADLAEIAGDLNLPVEALGTSRAEAGRSLGSPENLMVQEPKVAVLAGHPVHGYSFGWAWYTLDQRYRIPVTVLQTRSLAEMPLSDFNVLVIPHLISREGLAKVLGDAGQGRLKTWVRDGGTLVVIGSAVDLARRDLELIALKSFYPEPEKAKDGAAPEEVKPEDQIQRIDVPGAFVRAELDRESWLTVGFQGTEMPALVFSDRVYRAPEGPPNPSKTAPVRYAAEDLRLAGHLWPENLERLPGSVLVWDEKVGRGRVVAFAEDPNFRAFWRGGERLFLNAVVLGPSAP